MTANTFLSPTLVEPEINGRYISVSVGKMEVVNPFAAPITHGEIALRNMSGTLKQIQGWAQCCICVL
ncbi:unannotated protein [freshwater metagenome]|uniref:Unannotated protein n=1 Tax=freshwater metagenome TaxID=449393 RepID=A0A6J6K6I9_9ZZZZ